MKLTARQVETAKPKDKPYKLADGGGLYLLVNPNGKRYWRLKYRSLGKEKLLAIGVYPDVSLAEARNKREDAKRTLAAGNDPSLERKIEKLSRQQDAENSFEAITREWYQRRYDRWSVSYREEMLRTFEKDVFPYIGHRPIKDIKPMELLAVLSKIEARGATEKVRKVRQRCGEVWKYAVVTGRAEYNPAPDLASAVIPHEKEHYAFLTQDELPEFLRTLNTYVGSVLVKIAMQLLTGAGALLFPGRNNPKKPMSDMALTVLVRRIGYAGRVTGHGFRHTMSTILHEQGFNSAWIELQLAHVDKNSIRGTYNHAQYLEGRREMMQWYGDLIINN